MIKTDSLTKTYSSGTKALDNLTIHVKEGEVFGFLGPNGAGKSTAIKILTTLSIPTSGSAWVSGYNVLTDAGKVRHSIGYVAQETGVDYFLSGRENLVLQGRMYRMDKKDIYHRVEELLGLFDLKGSADELVSTYSGGMRRKLDIATALIHNPRVLFLDEPTLGLDPHSRSSLWNYIRMLNKDLKVTIFLTTHYLDEADKLSHRIGILHKGSIKIIDTPEALKDNIKGDSVNLSLNSGVKERAISILKGNTVVKDILCEDSHVRVYVNNGSEAIPGLMKLLNEHGIEISSLTISRPTLDDVYLKYSGVSFKEGESSEGSNPWWAQWAKKGWGKNWKGGEGEWKQEGSEGSEDGKDNDSETPSPLPSPLRGEGWVRGGFSDENKDWQKWQQGSDNQDNQEWKKWMKEDAATAAEQPAGDSWEKQKEAWNTEKGKDEKDEGKNGDNKKEEKNGDNNKEEAWKKWSNASDWEKWGKGGGKG